MVPKVILVFSEIPSGFSLDNLKRDVSSPEPTGKSITKSVSLSATAWNLFPPTYSVAESMFEALKSSSLFFSPESGSYL